MSGKKDPEHDISNRSTLELHRTPAECLNHRRAFDMKGTAMKRSASVLCAVTIAMAASSAWAQFPSSVDDTTSLVSEFPNIVTYADLHKNDFVRQANSPFPSSVDDTTSLVSEFPQITTYADLHKDDPMQFADVFAQ